MTFVDRLEDALGRKRNPCLVGLDPHLALLPEEFATARDPEATRAQRAHALGEFCCQLIDVVADRAPAVKPQSAFFEQLGADGVVAWERVVAHAHAADLLVIGDVKRGDIASTATAYAHAFLTGAPGAQPSPEERAGLCDAVTLNAFLGEDSVRPFLEAGIESGKGMYVLVRTSNPGSADFQRHGSPELSMLLADAVERWGSEHAGAGGLTNVGAVVGATHGDELRAFRERMPRTPFLLPGYGAQGATAADVVGAFLPGRGHPSGALVNSSRGISFAYRGAAYAGRHWKDAASAALDAMAAELNAALGV